jgi:hypothetical protein
MTIEEKLKELQALAEQIAPIHEAKSCKESDDEESEDKDKVSGDEDDSDIEDDDTKGMKESEEQLDELSKSTLGSYVKKATNAATQHGIHAGIQGARGNQTMSTAHSSMADKRQAGVGKAVSRLTKESEDVKIDLGNLFEGEELSEEFMAKATAVFESAVAMRVKQELAELKEGFEKQIVTESVELKESLVDKVDGYLDYMVEQWMEKNELAINRGIKTEILESFVSGMKGLFESHYIDVPDEKYDLVEAKQEEVQTLEQRLDEQTGVIITLQQQIKEISRQIQIDEACKGLADTDAERFRHFAEELTFTNSDEFSDKLNAIVESYFTSAPKSTAKQKVLAEEFMTDEPVEELNEDSSKSIDPMMAKYLKAIEKTGF